MSRFVTLTIAAAALALSLPLTAEAASSGGRVDHRQHNQYERIEDGVQSGALTWRETRRLARGQRHVARLERRSLADDGVLGPRERFRIERAQDRQSHRIFRQKHDRRHR